MAQPTTDRFRPKARHVNDGTPARAVDQAIEVLVLTDRGNRPSSSTCSVSQQQLCSGCHDDSTESNFAHLYTS
jgi:hypothetical protein